MKAFLTDVATCNDCSQQFCHVTYRLCNCLLAVVPQYQLNELQAVMNSAGRLICGLDKLDYSCTIEFTGCQFHSG